jgi:hypothetical protein
LSRRTGGVAARPLFGNAWLLPLRASGRPDGVGRPQPMTPALPVWRLTGAPTAVLFGLLAGGVVTPAILAPIAEGSLKAG